MCDIFVGLREDLRETDSMMINPTFFRNVFFNFHPLNPIKRN